MGGTLSEYFSEDMEDESVLGHLFALTFRTMRNRNLFVQRVFIVLGLQMVFAFVFFFIMVYKQVYLFFTKDFYCDYLFQR